MRPGNTILATILAGTALAAAAITGRAQPAEAAPQFDRSRLVLERLFDGNLADTSAPKRTGTARGAVAFAEGRHGKCLALDGRSWVDTGLLQKELGDEFTAVLPRAPSSVIRAAVGAGLADPG